MPLSLLLCVALGAAPENPDLKRGEELFAQYKYPEAIKALTRARGVPRLDRETLLRILELTAIATAQQRLPAQVAFEELLVLDPTHELKETYAPRVMTPFFEARQKVLEGGALEFRAGAPVTTSTTVEAVSARVLKDPLRQARRVRFHLAGSGGWSVVESPLSGGEASAHAGGAKARWWAELLTDNEGVVALIGSENEPQVDLPPTPPPVAVVPPVTTGSVEQAAPGSPVRSVSYGVLAAGLVSAGVGVGFGISANGAFSQLTGATRDSLGRVTSLTEKQAYDLQSRGKQNATIANAAFIGAGALAVVGAAMWWFGAPVVVAPGPGGVAVAGSFP